MPTVATCDLRECLYLRVFAGDALPRLYSIRLAFMPIEVNHYEAIDTRYADVGIRFFGPPPNDGRLIVARTLIGVGC
jgi:hypothetical protein